MEQRRSLSRATETQRHREHVHKKPLRLCGSVARRGEHRRKWLVATAFVVWLSPLSGQQLLDRIVARVNGEAITLTDVKAAVALGVVEVPAGAGDTSAIERLIDRQLVLAEVARFAPPEPAAADVAREAAALTARVGSRFAAVVESTGIDEARIRGIARDTLRIQAYVDQRFGATVQLTEEEVAQYYRIRPDEFTRDGTLMPFTQAQPLARARAGAERRASAVAQWIRDLRSRAEVQIRPSENPKIRQSVNPSIRQSESPSITPPIPPPAAPPRR